MEKTDQKNPIFKKWWFWVIIVVLIGAIGAGASENISKKEPVDSSVTTSQNDVKVEVETTTKKETQKATETTDKLLWSKKGVKIYYTGIEDDSVLGKSICLRIENNSNQKWTLQQRDLSINGYMINGLISADVEKGKKVNTENTLLESELEKNKIDEINDISLKLKLVDLDNFENDGFTSSIINIKVK